MCPAAEAAVSHDNRAFRYGYGLFETILVKDGAIILSSYHFERLFGGMQQLYFSVPKHFTETRLTTEVLNTVRKNKLEKLCRVRLQVYEGPGGLYDAVSLQPQFIIECFPLEAHMLSLNENGLVTGIATGMRKTADNLSYLKSCNALLYAVAAQQARQHRWNDALICNTDGNIIESTIANIFWVKDKKIFTPPLAEGCVAGVMRRFLLELLPSKGFGITEHVCTRETLQKADEVFLTNAIRRVKWVKEAAGHGYSHALTREIAQLAGNDAYFMQ